MKRILLAAATFVTVAACGAQPSATGVASVAKTSNAPTASASPTGTVDPEEQGRKFARCMRDNGVDMPDPGPEGNVRIMSKGPADKDKVEKAMKACQSLAPFKDRGPASPEDQEKMRQFAQCMRDNGIDMPDPEPNGALKIGGKSAVRRDDPKLQEALKACEDKMPGRGGKK
ncbi:hypothetical protein [Nonomuraea sp. LPB2021202275-12-8]|uniref:hypothetical protein n=1 Tax=Nonomuraea sp. LPB2021202275-12-8 TaxID=3120159 RepID=UPI00300CCE7A